MLDRSSVNTGPSNAGAPYPFPLRNKATASRFRLAGSFPVKPGTCMWPIITPTGPSATSVR
jgi:hypothetical protein